VTRFALTANEDAASLPHVTYVLLAEFEFSSGTVRLNSGVRTYTHQGNEFGAVGKLAGIGPVRENGNLHPDKLDFQLSGVDNSLIATTLTEDYHGRDVRLWVGYLNAETLDLVTTPQLIWEGLMDVMTIRTETGSSIITLTCENRLIRWNKSAGWLYTQEHQRLFDSTDDFFNQVSVIQNKVVTWGNRPVPVHNPGRPPNRGRPPPEEP